MSVHVLVVSVYVPTYAIRVWGAYVYIVHSYMLGSEFLYNNMQNITILFCNISNPNFRAINLHKCTYLMYINKTVLFSYFLQW